MFLPLFFLAISTMTLGQDFNKADAFLMMPDTTTPMNQRNIISSSVVALPFISRTPYKSKVVQLVRSNNNQGLTRLPLSSTSSHPLSSDENNDDDNNSKGKKSTSKAIKIWVHLLSVFVIFSYLQPLNVPDAATPSSITTAVLGVLSTVSTMVTSLITLLPVNVWSLIHALSGMVFGGSILCTTAVEWMWPDELHQMVSERADQQTSSPSIDDLSLQLLVNKMATKTLFPMEGKLVLPGVTGSMISGIAQSFYNYGSLRLAPRHVKSSLHLLFLFGLFWAYSDRKSQQDLLDLAESSNSWTTGDGQSTKEVVEQEMVSVWKRRRIVNLISCLFVLALYTTMVVKPGY
jgi:hypothetical protein